MRVLLALLAVVMMSGPVWAAEDGSLSKASAEVQGGAASLWKFIWGPPTHDETRLYINEAKWPHNSQWANDQWSPQDWIDARGGNAMAVVNGFYSAGIINDQYFAGDDVPVLEVGQRFFDLSDLDKQRVSAFIDHVFGVTRSDNGHGAFRLVFVEDSYFWGLWKEKRDIGLFTAQGVQIQ